MNSSGWIQLIFYVGILLAITKPLGIFLCKVLDAEGKTFLDPVIKPLEKLTYKLVTSEEADVTKGLISTTSPIGRALLGKEVGDIAMVVTPNGKRELELLKLRTIHDAAE